MRARDIILVYAFLLAIALSVVPFTEAATFACEIRASCLGNQTLLVRLNSSESGQAPNNSHAQLVNYSGGAYPYSVCCWTDSFRTLTNSCGGNAIGIVRLASDTNTHVEAGNMSTAAYPYRACMNVTSGNISCDYPRTSCAAGYSNILSLASSEPGDMNLTNAHLASPTFYNRQVCCQIGGRSAPTIVSANVTPINTTKRIGLTCNNGTVADADGDSVTLHYNWYRNGTSITVLNLPMDYDDVNIITHDISGYANHGTVTGATFLPTGGQVGGAFSFNSVANDYITVGNDTELAMGSAPFSVGLWVYFSAPQAASLVDKKNGTGVTRGYGMFLVGGGTPRFIVADGVSTATASGVALSNDDWTYVVGVRNSSGIYLYQDGVLAGSSASGGAFDVTNIITLRLGANSSLSDNFFAGRMDEVIIFNRSLTPNEILTMYNANNRHLNQSEMQKYDLWNCSITPVDSTGLNGSTAYSTGSYVNASIPYIVNLTYPLHNNQSVFERFVNFTWTAADEPDGDQVNYTLNVVVTPGTCSAQSTLTNLQTTNRTVGELCIDQMYNWTVNACDIDGCAGNTTLFNFTIASVIGIRLAGNVTAYGILTLSQNNATDGPGGPNPLILENDGNVRVNVSLNASQSPFTSVGLGNAAFQYRIADNETGSFNSSGSQITYTPVPSGIVAAIKQLNYSDALDSVLIHTNITVPSAETPGDKTTNLTLRAVVSPNP